MLKRTLFIALAVAAMTMSHAGQAQREFNQEQATPVDHRVPEADRLFVSRAIENEIARVQRLLTNKKLADMFAKCFPNTLDTTVHFRLDQGGKPDAIVYTGDIHAMWLRDSGAQVWPYVQFANNDPRLRQLIEGVIRRQFASIVLDPYANAFNDGPTGSYWSSDLTDMKPELHERKYEIDSLCYPLRLAYEYWRVTGDASIFDSTWLQAIEKILTVFVEQQRKNGRGAYKFQRKTHVATDTRNNGGYGNPVRPVGLIASAFRPSDDANVPSLLAMPYLGDVSADDPIYQNTRRFVLSEDNPYFFKGTAAEGIGGPHIGQDMIWPMSIMMRAFTSQDEAEIKWCVETLMRTDAGTGYMHESFHKDDPNNYTRRWFAWQNTLFGELILHLVNTGHLATLNSIPN